MRVSAGGGEELNIFWGAGIPTKDTQGKTKGQQLKGKIVS